MPGRSSWMVYTGSGGQFWTSWRGALWQFGEAVGPFQVEATAKALRQHRNQRDQEVAKGAMCLQGRQGQSRISEVVGESSRHSLCSSCWQSKVSGVFKLSRFAVLKSGTQLPRAPQETHRLDKFYRWREMHQFLTAVAKCELKIFHGLSIRLCSVSFFFFFLCVTFLSKISAVLQSWDFSGYCNKK